jgi:ATPase subunit of ABC transporter with duplicated ATPase domains
MSTEPTEENRRSPTIESLDSVKRSKGSKKGLSLTKKLHVKASQQQTTVKLAVQNSKTMIDPTRNQHRIAFKLEDFQKMGLLGSGGFGKVYLVRHLNSGTLFAMKIVKPSILQD